MLTLHADAACRVVRLVFWACLVHIGSHEERWCVESCTVADENTGGRKRGPKGGVKHTPGRGHDSKSGPSKKRQFGKYAAQRRKERLEKARKEWQTYDQLSDEAKKLLGPTGKPKLPRPKGET
jgi:hypothetical protein